jgi:hypothetical protein
MDEIIRTLPNYLTKETITVVGAIATAWIGWKVAAKSFGIVSSLATKFSFFGITAAIMFICGIGATGFGIAEVGLNSEEPPAQKGVSNEELRRLACGEDPELVKAVLNYVKYRDSNEGSDSRIQSIMHRVSNLEEGEKYQLLKFLQKENESEYIPADYNTTYEMNPPEPDLVKANQPSIGYSSSMVFIFTGAAVAVVSIITFIMKASEST